ncbi:hypothetical protein PVL29_023684 [Vitis rotundifolia]|uniref:Uncharacterized protein n=1 Tax=Vitis rotundifolia TaxID=103349 RepID=A0AA39D7V0_VITRO|nr:hypothetical protein PVL29_023684 [Vitis rotundifolia]
MTMAEISRDQVCAMAPGKLKSMIADDSRMMMMMSAEEGKKLEKTQKGPPSSVFVFPRKRERN